MDLHGHATNGMALANATLLMGLINHLISKQIVMMEDVQTIMDDALKGLADGPNSNSVPSLEARAIIEKMRDSI